MVGIAGCPGESFRSFSGRCVVPLNQVHQVKIGVFFLKK